MSTLNPKPIPEAPNLLIPWPRTRPLDAPVTAGMVKESWEAIIPGIEDGPQSGELRVLMAVIRAVYDGLHGITRQDEP